MLKNDQRLWTMLNQIQITKSILPEKGNITERLLNGDQSPSSENSDAEIENGRNLGRKLDWS